MCAALGRLCWSLCKLAALESIFFKLRIIRITCITFHIPLPTIFALLKTLTVGIQGANESPDKLTAKLFCRF